MPYNRPKTHKKYKKKKKSPDGRPYVCNVCSKTFRHNSNLHEHRSLHTQFKPFQCPYCQKSCRLKGNLKKHLAIHVTTQEELDAAWKPFAHQRSSSPGDSVDWVQNRLPEDSNEPSISPQPEMVEDYEAEADDTSTTQNEWPEETSVKIEEDVKIEEAEELEEPIPLTEEQQKVWRSAQESAIRWESMLRKGETMPQTDDGEKIELLSAAMGDHQLAEVLFKSAAQLIVFENPRCSDCGLVFNCSDEYINHQQKMHKAVETDFFCKDCSRFFKNTAHYESHISFHEIVKRYLRDGIIDATDPDTLVPTFEHMERVLSTIHPTNT